MKNFLILFLLYVLLYVEAGRSQTVSTLLEKLSVTSEVKSRAQLLDIFFQQHAIPFVEGDSVWFIYRGNGNRVAVPGELNQWNPHVGLMKQVPGTDVHYRSYQLPKNGRVEYKIWVDSTWMLDPRNPRKAQGGFGYNSDVWMPEYQLPDGIEYQPGIPHGSLDTIFIESKFLNRRCPLFIYLPAGIRDQDKLPAIFITDGGDYLTFGKLNIILDNLIAAKKIQPVIGVFIDPQTDLSDPSTNQRMNDYTASEAYLDFLEKELSPYLASHYRTLETPHSRMIMGVSMGGLIATYAAVKRSGFISNCASQSPAYMQADSAVIKLLRNTKQMNIKAWIDTGTINDTQPEANLVYELLKRNGATVKYIEVPEGHNWSNWRSRMANILEYFFPLN